MNEYLKDSLIFLKKCTTLICNEMNNEQIIESVLHLAIGIERILKAILWDINPVYVLKKESFRNSAPILYKHKLISENLSNKEFSQNPNSDVLTFRKALLRAKEFSPITLKYFNTLFTLSNYRDTIAHRPLKEVDIERLKKLLLHDLLNVIKDYSHELDILLTEFIGDKIQTLEFLSKDYEGDLYEKMQKKIKFYRSEWERIKQDPTQAKRIEKLHEIHNDKTSFNYGECPACGNAAKFSAEIDYDYSDGQTWAVGVYPTALKCSFCGFFVTDDEEMDFLKLHKIFYEHQENINLINQSS